MSNLSETKERVVIGGGGGHVGLPLGLALSKCGYSVIAFDTSASTVEQINLGVIPFIEEGAEALLESSLEANKFRASIDPKCLVDAEIIVFVIGVTRGHDDSKVFIEKWEKHEQPSVFQLKKNRSSREQTSRKIVESLELS